MFLEGNDGLMKQKDWKSFVIYNTRNLRGDNRTNGLLELNGMKITSEERVSAVSTHSKGKDALDPTVVHWELLKMNYFGRSQLNDPSFSEKTSFCILPCQNLGYIDVQFMPNLTYLDLSDNNLTTVPGLETLLKLVKLNLSLNPRLKIKKLLSSLKCSTLRNLTLYSTETGSNYSKDNNKYRKLVFNNLLPSNPFLTYLDGKTITVLDRVETVKFNSRNEKDAELYRFNLAIVLQTVEASQKRCLHPDYVVPGKQYEFPSITKLSSMNGFGIISSVCDFSPFENLVELNLSNNKLTDVTCMGLEKLKNLEILDLSNNQIKNPIKKLGSFIDQLSKIHVICLRGNPVIKNSEDREKLLGAIKTLREVSCTLQVLDTQITLKQRLDAWKKAGGQNEEIENLRTKVTMLTRVQHPNSNDLTCLDFSDTGMQRENLIKYPNLSFLSFRGNNLKDILHLESLDKISKLEVLDLRDNQIKSFSSVSPYLEKFPRLKAIGLSGNKIKSDYRTKILSKLTKVQTER